MLSENRSSEEVRRLRSQRAALAAFGKHALNVSDLDSLLHEACRLISAATGSQLVKVLELLPDGATFLIREGVGWKPGVVGRETFGADALSPAGHALKTDGPVISNDIASEGRFAIPRVLWEHGIKSMVNVVIRCEHAPWGVLELDAPEPQSFDTDDTDFLATYANVLGAAIDRLRKHDALAAAAETQRVLLDELHHRVRNMLANIRALAKRTAATAADLTDFGRSFDARVSALARTQELLSRSATHNATVRDVVLLELEAHGAELGRRVVVEGPAVVLPRKAIQVLALAVHELATNAVKYGALRTEGASIAIAWRVEMENGEKWLSFSWRETGVPQTGPPRRRGFGSQVIESSAPYMLGGTSQIAFEADGVHCRIRFPLTPTAADH